MGWVVRFGTRMYAWASFYHVGGMRVAATVVAIANQKGGVGKTTTAHAIGSGLAARGKRVLFVDLDAQGNLSYVLGAREGHSGAYHLLMRQTKSDACVQRVSACELIASSPELHAADMELTMTGKEYRLREGLASLLGSYDFVIVDTPPALGTLTVNALTAAAGVIVPAQADVFSLQGVGQLYQTIEAVQRYCNPNLAVLGILMTRFSPRAILSRDMYTLLQQTAQALGTKVFDVAVRETVVAREAAACRQDLLSYAPKSNVTLDYDALIDELLGVLRDLA